jgi:protein SCO1/2
MNFKANPSRPLRFPLGFRAACAALALAACGSEPGTSLEAGAEPPLAGATIGGDFALTDSEGETVRWSDFEGQYRIVYFGYAYCPDICPTDMQRTVQGLNAFAEDNPDLAAKIQPIFITIDPQRDTREVVGEFTNAFSEDLIGLTGTEEEIAEAAAKFGVYYTKLDENESGSYLMDHSRIVFLFGPQGEPIAMLPADESAQAVREELGKWVS